MAFNIINPVLFTLKIIIIAKKFNDIILLLNEKYIVTKSDYLFNINEYLF